MYALHVLHRIDDLEKQLQRSTNWRHVLHRIDDLEIPTN